MSLRTWHVLAVLSFLFLGFRKSNVQSSATPGTAQAMSNSRRLERTSLFSHGVVVAVALRLCGSTNCPRRSTWKEIVPDDRCYEIGPKKLVATQPRGGSYRGGSLLAMPLRNKRTLTATQMRVLNLLSGGIAGTIASCLTNPLEVVKSQLQSSIVASGELATAGGHPLVMARRIYEKDGTFGFFRGLRPTLVGIIPARSAYFYAYEQTKRHLPRKYLPPGSTGNALVSGLIAGLVGNTLTNPIWMVKTRMQLLADKAVGQRAYSSYTDVVSTIVREEGISGFYKGIFASYWGCAEGSIQFVLYERLKRTLLHRQNEVLRASGRNPRDKLPKLTYFLSAAAAKSVASIATYPHEVARTRLREQARLGVFKYHGMWQTLRLVAREEGRRGLYAGMGLHLVKVVPNSAIMFLTYELVNSWLDQFRIATAG